MSRKKERRKKKRSPVEILGFLGIAAFVVGLIWLVFFTAPLGSGQTTKTPLPAHSFAPDFALTDVDGRTFKLSDYQGKVVVLEFMQTTCGACISQEPRMRELRSRFGSNLVTVIITLNPEDTEEVLKQYRDQHMAGWIAIRDTSGVSRTYNVDATPTIFIIDKNGYVAYQHVGFTDSASASALISEVSGLV